jgi:iron complex outermembrane receptor protein
MNIKKISFTGSVCLSVFLLPAIALADEVPDTSFTIGEIIVVKGKRENPNFNNVITSVDRLVGQKVQGANANYIWEVIGQMPGVLVTNFNQGTTSGKISFRGFNGEGEVNAAKLLIDGVPSNSNDGNMPYIDAVSPLNISGIEVVRGTSDARYGLNNIAGNANIITRQGGDYFDTKLLFGSYNTKDAQIAFGTEIGDFSQNYAIAYRETDGYRQHSDLDRLSASAKLFYKLNDSAEIGLNARHYKSEADEAGYLIKSVAYSTPKATNDYNATDGDKRIIDQISLNANFKPFAGLKNRNIIYYNKLDDNRFVKFSTGGAQQNRITKEEHYGLISNFSLYPKSDKIRYEFGFDYQHQDNISQRYLAVQRVATSKTRDQKFDIDNFGAFFEAVYTPNSKLTITPAIRFDKFDGDFQNILAASTAKINDYGIISQPKLMLSYAAAEDTLFYANYGRTFQIGVGSGAYLIPPRNINLEPSINEGFEFGVKHSFANNSELRLAAWQQTATGEIKRKLNDALGDFDNLGATRRQGFDIQFNSKINDAISYYAVFSYQSAKIETPDPATPQYQGNDIDHIPTYLGNIGIDYKLSEKLKLSLNGRGQSDYELDSSNSRGRFGDYFVFDLAADYKISENWAIGIQVKNLADKYYEYVWWDSTTNQTLHSPADGRSYYLSISSSF